MLDFISNKKTFKQLESQVNTLFRKISFEENPFKENFRYFIAFEFDFIYHESFFEGLKLFLKEINNQSVIFYTIAPCPEKYFYDHFGTYSVFEIDINASDDDLNEIITKDPGGSSADSLDTNANEICWFSNTKDWAILGSRDWEIAVVGFTSAEIKQKFIESFSEDGQTMFTSIKTQADALDEMLNFSDKIKKEYQELVRNYQDR